MIEGCRNADSKCFFDCQTISTFDLLTRKKFWKVKNKTQKHYLMRSQLQVIIQLCDQTEPYLPATNYCFILYVCN